MMLVVCSDCNKQYDDTYHLTNCPHKYFQMHTVVSTGYGSRCCHTIEELNDFLNLKKISV